MAFLAPFLAGFGATLSAGSAILGARGSREATQSNEALTREQIAFQQELARNQIQWRVEDAMRAGVHPLAALGAVPYSYSPVSGSGVQPDYSGLGAFGQDLSRASLAMYSDRERREAFEIAQGRQAVEDMREAQRHAMDMETAELNNQILRSQLARVSSAQVGPSAPERVDTVRPGSVRQLPATVIQGASDNRAREPGAITAFQYQRTADGGLSIVQSEQSKERTEDDFLAQLDWGLRYRLGPALTSRGLPRPPGSQYPTPVGTYWRWNNWRQAFYPYHTRGDYWIIGGRRYRAVVRRRR